MAELPQWQGLRRFAMETYAVAVHGSRFTVHGFQDILSAFLASFRPSRHASISLKRSIFIVRFLFSTVNREP
jgi:hypothetical protein